MLLFQSHTPWYRDGYKVGMFGYSRSTKDKLTVTRSGAGVVNSFVVNNLDSSPVKQRDALPSRRTQAVWVFRLDERVMTSVSPARCRAPGRSRSTPELLGTGSPSNRDRYRDCTKSSVSDFLRRSSGHRRGGRAWHPGLAGGATLQPPARRRVGGHRVGQGAAAWRRRGA